MEAGATDRLFEDMQMLQLLKVMIKIANLDRTNMQVAPRRARRPGGWGPKSHRRQSLGTQHLKEHLAAAGLNQVHGYCLSPGQARDAPVNRELINDRGIDNLQTPLVMDRAD